MLKTDCKDLLRERPGGLRRLPACDILSVFVCSLEAVDLSSTNRHPVDRVLPPPRPPSISVLRSARKPSMQAETSQSHQPTLKPPPLLVIPPSLPTILPSIVDPAALKPLITAQFVAPVSPHSADPGLSPGPDRQLDLAGQRGGDTAAVAWSSTAGQKASFGDAERRPLLGPLILPSVVSSSTADKTATVQLIDSETESLPDDLSTKQEHREDKLSKLSIETKAEQMCIADDLSAAKSDGHLSPLADDNLSIETVSRHSLSPDTEAVTIANTKRMPDTCNRLLMEMRMEGTFGAESLPIRRDSLLAEVTRQETLQSNSLSTESETKPEKMDAADECVNAMETDGATASSCE